MSRYLFIINNTADRARALRVVATCLVGSRLEIKAAQRTIPQNDRMWAMLTDVSRQLKWHGRRLRPDDWKVLFLYALKRERDMVPSIDDLYLVDLRRSSSDLSKSEMSDMMELIAAFGANHGVTFHGPQEGAA